MINDHPVIRNLMETGFPDARSDEEFRCPNCDAVAETYYELDGTIIGCEHCVKLRWWYEVNNYDER